MTYFKAPEPQINAQKKVQLPGKVSVRLVSLFFVFFSLCLSVNLVSGAQELFEISTRVAH